ncbi:trypsin-like peptidase domain-containing protein, partial [Deinococcus sp. SM5_A1]|uniref:trypsin-like peptidase domain-containing protein n=1 Tax=Deinococcus sp. SM5_A1 TaxID=3379094 RepID=UPI003859442D
MISPVGYVLTKLHVVGDTESHKVSDWILVGTVKFVDREPEPACWGRVVAADANLELAVVGILENHDQKPVGALNLPFVELGDSNSLTVGDPLFVFGFRGMGSDTLIYTSGAGGGLTGENTQGSGRQWIPARRPDRPRQLIRIPFVSCRNRNSADPSTPRPEPVFL